MDINFEINTYFKNYYMFYYLNTIVICIDKIIIEN